MNQRQGKIKFVNFKAKFGFIRDIETGEEFYFRIADLKTKEKELEGILLSFDLKQAKRGLQAINILRILDSN